MIDVPRLWPKEFDKPDEQPIHFARINVNGAILRVLVTPAGRIRILVPKSAIDCGDIVTWDDTGEPTLFGFTPAEIKEP